MIRVWWSRGKLAARPTRAEGRDGEMEKATRGGEVCGSGGGLS